MPSVLQERAWSEAGAADGGWQLGFLVFSNVLVHVKDF